MRPSRRDALSRDSRPRDPRGSANWPFIIALILLLVFVAMWWVEKSDNETARVDLTKKTRAEEIAREAARSFSDGWVRLSSLVGKRDARMTEVAAVSEDAKALADEIADGRNVTDPAWLQSQLAPDGRVGEGDQARPGLYNYLRTQAVIQMQANIRSGDAPVETQQADFAFMTDDLKRKIQEVAGIQIPEPPVPPADRDDASAVADYEARLREYEEAVARWQAGMEEVVRTEGWKEYSEIIKVPGQYPIDRSEVVRVAPYKPPPVAEMTVETLLPGPIQVIEGFKQEFRANKEADIQVIEQVRGQVAQREEEVTRLQGELLAQQGRYTTDVEALREEASAATQRAEQANIEATRATQARDTLAQQAEAERKRFLTDQGALQERIRIDKEERDLAIRRNDPDGNVVSASTMMRTAIINLGRNHKVFPGLKFQVMAMGRGGLRVGKGEVQVVEVLDANTSKVSVLSLVNPNAPLLSGDTLHNPFYSPTETIHVYLVGTLDRYPREIAVQRLERMGVVVQSQPTGDTDYFVIPTSMADTRLEAAGEDEDEGPAPGQSEVERVESMARRFGATVITERQLNQFLEY